jgi:hypothetical protein
MTSAAFRRIDLGSRSMSLLGWGVVMAAVLLLSALVERSRLSSELTNEATILHRLLSQRADQHDAHLTALSALRMVATVPISSCRSRRRSGSSTRGFWPSTWCRCPTQPMS